jgi:hypothetical protein
MEIKEYQIKKILVLTKLKCSCCKKEYDYIKDQFEIQEFIQIFNSCGYNSIFGDNVYYRLDLCQYCVKKLLGEYLEFHKKEEDD